MKLACHGQIFVNERNTSVSDALVNVYTSSHLSKKPTLGFSLQYQHQVQKKIDYIDVNGTKQVNTKTEYKIQSKTNVFLSNIQM